MVRDTGIEPVGACTILTRGPEWALRDLRPQQSQEPAETGLHSEVKDRLHILLGLLLRVGTDKLGHDGRFARTSRTYVARPSSNPRNSLCHLRFRSGPGWDRTSDLPRVKLKRCQKRDVCAGQAGRTGPSLRVQSTRYERRGGCGADENRPAIRSHRPILRPGAKGVLVRAALPAV